MHKKPGVRSAIQSLAGIYIYDYRPVQHIKDRVIERFTDAERRFTELLNDSRTSRDGNLADELITIAVILSMQDVRLFPNKTYLTHLTIISHLGDERVIDCHL